MNFLEFKQTVADMMDRIPEHYFNDLQGVHVFEETKGDPSEPGLVRLGEYTDPGIPQFLSPHAGLGRHIALYYGSFQRVGAFDSNYDWAGQIWETLTHELRHHVESKAGDRSLIEWDIQQLEQYRNRLRQ